MPHAKGVYVTPKPGHIICQFTTEELEGMIDAIDFIKDHTCDAVEPFTEEDITFYRGLRLRTVKYFRRCRLREAADR